MGKAQRTIREAGFTFISREVVTAEKKKIIENHPQCQKYFRFRKFSRCSTKWHWFVRVRRYN